jgi:O-antigen biosynthesis protein WbqP
MPQLWSILIGDMSFVGPRPALFNQIDLIKLREEFAINNLKPGLTGLAQINGRDDLSLIEKVNFDREYFNKQSMYFDIKIILTTFIKVILCKNVSH